MLEVTRRSMVTGKYNTMSLPITIEQLNAWQNGDTVIQVALPTLDADQREFLLTGMMPDEWNAMFPDE